MSIVFAHEEVRRLKVAVVGCGNHSYRSLFPCFDYLALELAAVCDVDLARARKYAAHFGAPAAYGSLEELLKQGGVEAVLLAVGPEQHSALACQALEAGLHVWMEKPPALNVAGVDRMRAARDRSGKVAAVGFKKAFQPGVRKMKEALESGAYGRVRTIASRHPFGLPENGPAVLAAGTVTNWLGNGVHPLSLLVHLGGRPEALTAHRASNGGGFIIFHFSSGALGCLHDAHGAASGAPMERCEAVCEKGHLVLENNLRLTLHRPGMPFDYRLGHDFTEGPEAAAALVYEPQQSLSTLYNKAVFIQGFVQELDHFAGACLAGRAVTVGTLEDARAVMECYEAGLLSQGRTVRLDDLPALRT